MNKQFLLNKLKDDLNIILNKILNYLNDDIKINCQIFEIYSKILEEYVNLYREIKEI